MEHITVIGLDLAKNIFQLHCADDQGHCVQRKTIRRNKLLTFFSNLAPCIVGMEACGSSHYWAREIKKLGHDVKLMAPQYVKPYVKTNKNDAADAEAICEAVTRPGMRFVDIKSADQQSILLLHRDREGLIKERTALINRLRATAAEFGVTIPSGPHRLKHWFMTQFSTEEKHLPELMRRHICRMKTRLNQLESAIAQLDEELNNYSRSNDDCRRLEDVPGIGRLTASALEASIGRGQSFKNGCLVRVGAETIQ